MNRQDAKGAKRFNHNRSRACRSLIEMTWRLGALAARYLTVGNEKWNYASSKGSQIFVY
jgi:hypothetical protein